jgi:SSS family transporter
MAVVLAAAGTLPAQPDRAATRPAPEDRPATTEQQEELGYRDGSESNSALKFVPLEPLPQPVRGAFMGTLDGVMVVAGGVQSIPETGSLSECRFLDTIYYMEPGAEGRHMRWKRASLRLPTPTAFGATAISEQGMVCLGGWTPDGVTNRVFRIVWTGEKNVSDLKKKEEPGNGDQPQEEKEKETVRLLRLKHGDFYEVGPEDLAKLDDATLTVEDIAEPEPAMDMEGVEIQLETGRLVVYREGTLRDAESDEEVEVEEISLAKLADGQVMQVVEGKIPGHFEVKQEVKWDEEDEVWKGVYHLPEPLAFSSAMVMQDGLSGEFHLYLVGGYRPRGSEPSAVVPGSQGTAATTAPASDRLSSRIYRCRLPRKLEFTGVLNRIRSHAKVLREGKDTREPQWEVLETKEARGGPVSPLGEGVVLPLLAVSRSEWAFKDVLYVAGGLRLSEDGEGFVQSPTVWRFSPGEKSRDGWYEMKDLPPKVAVYSAVEVGPSHMLVLAEKDATQARTLNEVAAKDAADSLFSYHRITETWVDLTGDEPVPGGEMFKSGEDFIWIGHSKVRGLVVGEQEEGLSDVIVGGAEKGSLEYTERHFTAIDFLVIGAYIFVLIWIGTYFAKRERDTDDYFLGGRKIPWWAAGISIYATGISAISFMAIPAKTYALDWSYICLGIFPPIMVFVAAYTFVPLLRGLEITTMMEYMEMRFGKSVRTLNTAIMVAIQVGGRMSVTLLLPALALSAVTGWNIYACVLVMGVLATVYTVMGGISAVIWTDVAQVCVIFGGAILSFIIICFNVDGGLGGVVEIGMNFEKFRSFDFAWDFTVPTFWVFTVWAMADLFGKLGQEGMQRAFATRDVKSARRSMITMAVVSVPGTLLFYGLGAALFAYYHQNPQNLNPNLQTDATFPLFISQQLPTGVAGLVIAGLFAAAMSTLDSGMNSVATVITRDFYAAFRKDTPESRRLYVARWITIVAGGLGTLLALYMASFDLPSLWDTFSEVMGLIGGGFGGVIVLALLTKRANTPGVLIGTVLGTLMLISLKTRVFGYDVSFFIYGSLSMAVTITTGYLFSLIIPSKPKDLSGLTLWTIRKKPSGENIYEGPR